MGNISRFIFCVALLLTSPAWAALPAPGATAQDLLQWLEQGSAELAAVRHETESARQRAAAAGALPDPSLRIEWQDVSRGNLLPGRVGAVKYTVLQPLPGWGKRAAQKQVAQAETAFAQEQERATGLELRTGVKLAFARYYRTHAALQLNAAQIKFADSIAAIAQARYETGTATQQEVVKAQLERAALQAERIALQAEYAQNQARINALLNRPAHAALSEPAALRVLPPPAALNPEALEQRLSSFNPQLAGQVAQYTLGLSNVELASKILNPDFVLGLSPVQQGNRLSSWDAMLEFSIPLQRIAHGAHQREAAEMLEASRIRLIATEARLLGELREHLAALQAAREQEELARTQVLPLAELAFQGAQAGYQQGLVDFATVLEAARQVQKAKVDALDASVEQQIRLAEIERLTGEES